PHTPPQDIFPGRATFSVSPANYLDWKAQADLFSPMAIYTDGNLTLTGFGEPESIPAGWVSAEFFDVLGAHPLAGRLFLPGDDEDDRPVAVLSGGFWKGGLGAARSA